jgi:hypothetical protein
MGSTAGIATDGDTAGAAGAAGRVSGRAARSPPKGGAIGRSGPFDSLPPSFIEIPECDR